MYADVLDRLGLSDFLTERLVERLREEEATIER